MSSYDRIIRILNNLAIYNLTGNSLIEAEMKAYCAVFDTVYEEIERIIQGCFLDEINSFYFNKFERLFAMPMTPALSDDREKISLEKVEMMKKRLSIKNDDFNLKGVKKAISSGGMEVDIKENFNDKSVTVTILKDSNICIEREEKEAFIKTFLPVHCKLILN